MRRAGIALLRASLVLLALMTLGPVCTAIAEPRVTLNPPKSPTEDRTPSFTGTATDVTPVTVRIHAGATAKGTVVSTATAEGTGGAWASGDASPALSSGQYTALAVQASSIPGEPAGRSAPVTFTVVQPPPPPRPPPEDGTPPHITMTFPANGSSTSGGSQLVKGSAGTEAGDLPTVTIQLFAGATIGARVEALTVQASNGSWWATFGGLGPGTYTARAEQSDHAGNIGMSAPVTFTLTAPASPLAPVASFKWFPSAPKTGESVSLVSSSIDIASPITAFEWALTGNAAFRAGKPLLTTSFSTPGPHLVRLRVIDANGLSSIATETIPVTSTPLLLMQPFPIVRIAGYKTSSGVHLSLLTAQAPVGARVSVRCRGRGCPARSQSRRVVSRRSKAGAVTVEFRRFERSLRAGVTLEVRVSAPGEIGKYTRFAVRRHSLPVRVDSCLSSTGIKPIACPSS